MASALILDETPVGIIDPSRRWAGRGTASVTVAVKQCGLGPLIAALKSHAKC